MNIIFHGDISSQYRDGLESLLDFDANIRAVSDQFSSSVDMEFYRNADVLVSTRYQNGYPELPRLRLFQAPAAGIDKIEVGALPSSAALCNCYGHEHAIAEYVMAALLRSCIPLEDADTQLRQGHWPYRAGAAEGKHLELGGTTLGILGYGRIGKEIARRASAFDMDIWVANRSDVADDGFISQYFPLAALEEFVTGLDFLVVSIPLNESTIGVIDVQLLSLLKPSAILINVSRGEIVNERALFDALSHRTIGGAVIDTWYKYPPTYGEASFPSDLPFWDLKNVLMTPHMSAWTAGLIVRRRQTIADNCNRLILGKPLLNRIK